MGHRSFRFRALVAAPLLGGVLLLGGCGGVEFEGKAFEMIGLANKPKQMDAKVPDRAPLVLPPKRDLPEPGTRRQAAIPSNWPNDADAIRKEKAAEEKRSRKSCPEVDFKSKSSIEQFDEITDPLRRCKGFLGKKATIQDSSRGDGSPDTVVEQPDDLSTKKQLPSPWLTQTNKPGN